MNKKTVIIIASNNFRDEECLTPKKILEEENITIAIASDQLGIARGANGAEIKVDLLVQEIKLTDFDAIIFVGGPGALKHLDNEISYNLAKSALQQGKILAAICIAPVILAKAGVLQNKKATVWSNTLEKTPIKILGENGAEYLAEKVTVDGNIITANGPVASAEFAREILKALRK